MSERVLAEVSQKSVLVARERLNNRDGNAFNVNAFPSLSLAMYSEQVAPSRGLSNRYHPWSELVLVSIALWYHGF